MNFVLSSVPFSLQCHKLFSPKNLIFRRISILGKTKEKPVCLDKSNHRVIYHFKYIVFPAGVSKAKYKIPLISVPFISFFFYDNEPKIAALITIASILHCGLMVFLSRICDNIIGKIYVNKEGEINNVIISSIDSNGNRKDESFSPDELFLYENPFSKYFGFLQMTTSSNKNYKINLKNAKIQDIEALRSIFEDIVIYLKLFHAKKKK